MYPYQYIVVEVNLAYVSPVLNFRSVIIVNILTRLQIKKKPLAKFSQRGSAGKYRPLQYIYTCMIFWCNHAVALINQ